MAQWKLPSALVIYEAHGTVMLYMSPAGEARQRRARARLSVNASGKDKGSQEGVTIGPRHGTPHSNMRSLVYF